MKVQIAVHRTEVFHVSRLPGAKDATPPARLAVPLAIAIVADFAFAAARVDSGAFQPGSRDETGNREGAGPALATVDAEGDDKSGRGRNRGRDGDRDCDRSREDRRDRED
ncbi:MAG: hypothetical protein DCF28_11415, partial [Alphaproteobacteria bacterium]